MAIIILAAFAVLYLIVLFYWNKKVKWRLPKKATSALRLVHFISFAVMLIVAILYFQLNIGLRGLWTTRAFIVTFIVSGIFFPFLGSKREISKIENWYLKAFSLFPIAIDAVLCIPFLGIVLVISLFGRLVDPATDVLYEDSNIRVQSTFVGALGPATTDIYQKNGLFEKHLKRINAWVANSDSVEVIYGSKVTRVIFYDAESRSEPYEKGLKEIK